MSDVKNTPIAIFTYKRPYHARRLFESLLKCSRLDECSVYIFCDGPKKEDDVQNVQAMRRLAYEFAPLLNNAAVVERERNLGLARSIVSGVTDLCGRYGRVIVLEDDLIVHPFFLDFMLQSLERYAGSEEVAQVAGFTFPIHMPQSPDAFFLPLTTSWGWATWQRAWKLFSWQDESALETLNSNPSLRKRFDLDGVYPFSEMLGLTLKEKTDSWAIHWYWTTFFAEALTLYPRSSLVWQNGFDGFATNTTDASLPLQRPFELFLQESWKSPLSFPKEILVDENALKRLKILLRGKPSKTFLPRVKETLKNMLKSSIKKFGVYEKTN